jgi:hypothetical protein
MFHLKIKLVNLGWDGQESRRMFFKLKTFSHIKNEKRKRAQKTNFKKG